MDAKVTLSFDASVISAAKQFAESHGISLSRLIEILLRKAVAGKYTNIEDIPIAAWVSQVAEGDAEYVSRPKTSRQRKSEYFKSRK